jgi:hypothetical protein
MAIKDGKFIDKKSIKELVEILDEMKLSSSFLPKRRCFYFSF